MGLPEPGAMFESRYRLDAVLGAGGFATVYRATDVASSREVAIKILRPELTGYPPSLRARFEREVRLVGNLRDEHTVTMFDHGTSTDGLLYMVTEYVPGEDLEQLLERRGRLEPAEVVHIVRQVLTSLHEAHAAGLLHRDIKPGNILVYSYLGDDLRVKVLDFGIAKELDDDEKLTSDGELVGTLRYMSPEQLMSEPLTPASDIYSLGIVAFELLLGSNNIHGRALHDQLDRLATGYLFSVPELQRMGALAPTLDRMTARRPGDRFQSAAQVMEALEAQTPGRAVPQQLPGPPQPVGPPVSAPPSTERRRVSGSSSTPPALVASVIGALALLVAGALFFALSTEEAAAPVQRKRPPPSALLRATPEPVAPQPERPKVAIRRAPTPLDSGPKEALAAGCGERLHLRGSGKLRARDGLDVEEIDAFVPDAYDRNTPIPIVILLPENGEGPQTFMEYSGMTNVAQKHGFILVAIPQPIYAWMDEAISVAHVEDAIRIAATGACVDMDRIYLVGHANGGRGAEFAAASIPEIRAIAVTAHRSNVDDERPSGPLTAPYLLLAPTKDKYNKVEGGMSCDGPKPYLSLAEQESIWRQRHDCEEPATTWFKHRGSVCTTWSCRTPYTSCHLDGGRNWPGQPDRLWDYVNCDGTPADFPFGETIWKFFEEHSE